MPELPEVETVKNSLKQLILGQKIKDVLIYYPKIIKNVSIEEFRNQLLNQTFRDIIRKGKYLIFLLDSKILISHLRMEGKYLLRGQEEAEKHEHIVFCFDDGASLRYHDTRKFGTMFLYPAMEHSKLYEFSPLDKVGPDPTDPELSAAYLFERFQKTGRSIKSVLLDQTIVSGLGNIYVNEVCFMSHLHPSTSVKALTLNQVEDILENARIVLKKSIELGGTTVKSFMSSHEVSGKFQNQLFVHTKDICPNCQGKIIKIRVSGRGTYLCENCQKLLDKEFQKD